MPPQSRLFILLVRYTLLASSAALLLAGPSSVAAQTLPPGAIQHPDGAWLMPANASAPEAVVPSAEAASGGPDTFGYVWNDSQPPTWITTTGGSVLGLNGYSDGEATGPIALPFEFPYYEQRYTQVWIAASGYLSFAPQPDWPSQPAIPSPAAPNLVIAPYASNFTLSADGSDGRIYHVQGGSAPNRYFVVEWHKVRGGPSQRLQGVFTFQVILWENGDIRFQYADMAYDSNGWWCGAAGIEDATGQDGLSSSANCTRIPSNTAVHFTRPPASARVSILHTQLGRFTQPLAVETFPLVVRNTGDLGDDVYTLNLQSSWPAMLRDERGGTVGDTNGDGLPDTGTLAPGAMRTLMVSMHAPAVLQVGDHNVATLTATSNRNASKQATVRLQTALAPSFAQIYADWADSTPRLARFWPSAATTAALIAPPYRASNLAVTQLADGGYAAVWSTFRCGESECGRELEVRRTEETGVPRGGVIRVTNHHAATIDIFDQVSSIAQSSDGRLGILWQRYESDAQDRFRYNIFFAILERNGSFVLTPTRLTSNNDFQLWNAPELHFADTPTVAATADNRFFLAWGAQVTGVSGQRADIFHAVYDSAGKAVKGVTQYTNSTPDRYGNYVPHVIPVRNNRILLIYTCEGGSCVRVFNSAGAELARSALASYAYAYSGAQLAGGNILLAWQESLPGRTTRISYALLDGTNYARIAGPSRLETPERRSDDGPPSVTLDGGGNGIISWTGTDRADNPFLYVAAVRANGTLLLPAQPFYEAMDGWNGTQVVESATNGQGLAPLHTMLPVNQVDTYVRAPAWIGAPIDGNATFTLDFGNRGGQTAANGVLTAILPEGLTYAAATPPPSAVTPVSTAAGSGTELRWDLPSMSHASVGRVHVQVTTPDDGELGDRFPVQWRLVAAGDADASNNAATLRVFLARQLFLSTIGR